MKPVCIPPAEVDFSDPTAPAAPAFGDVYHSRAGALAQARHVFVAGNGLPGRWQGRERFVVLETGFGLGNNFLATWDAWRQDPARCTRLVFVSVEKHPLRREDLARAHAASPLPELATQLVERWPPLTAGLHTLGFEGGRVELLLGLGDARELLRELVLSADALYLDGFSPKLNPALWDDWLLKSLARHAVPGTTAATWSIHRPMRRALASLGFDVELAPGFANKPEMTTARFAPRHVPQRPAGRERLEEAHRGRADRENAWRSPDPLPRARFHRVALAVNLVRLDHLLLQRPKGVQPDVQRHALDVELREHLRREVQAVTADL